jgi:putative phage-type endonuclease
VTAVATIPRSTEGLGASQVAAALGLHPYCARITLWQELVGELPGFEGNERTRWGNLLEPVVLQQYIERHELEGFVIPGPEIGSVFHAEHPWARATPDGIVLREGLGLEPSTRAERVRRAGDRSAWKRGIEIKTAGLHQAHRWGADDEHGETTVPIEYLIQCQWSMFVTGLPRWDVAALIGGQEEREAIIERDDELLEMVVPEAEAFWRCVETRTPPEIDGTEACRDYITAKHPHVREEYAKAGPALQPIVAELRDVRAEIAAFELRKGLLENLIRDAIGDASGLLTKIGKLTCRPRAGRTLTDWEAIARTFLGRLDFVASAVEHGGEDTESIVEGIKLALEAWPPLSALVAKHTTQGKASRPLIVPKNWSK